MQLLRYRAAFINTRRTGVIAKIRRQTPRLPLQPAFPHVDEEFSPVRDRHAALVWGTYKIPSRHAGLAKDDPSRAAAREAMAKPTLDAQSVNCACRFLVGAAHRWNRLSRKQLDQDQISE
jgi:hypothetical protein